MRCANQSTANQQHHLQVANTQDSRTVFTLHGPAVSPSKLHLSSQLLSTKDGRFVYCRQRQNQHQRILPGKDFRALVSVPAGSTRSSQAAQWMAKLMMAFVTHESKALYSGILFSLPWSNLCPTLCTALPRTIPVIISVSVPAKWHHNSRPIHEDLRAVGICMQFPFSSNQVLRQWWGLIEHSVHLLTGKAFHQIA